MNVSKDNLESLGLEFKPYQKQGLTMMAGPFEPPVNVETVTGWHLVDDQPCYVALDADGYPYPIAQSIFEASFVPVLEMSDEPQENDTSRHRVEVYLDEGGVEYRWRRKAANGEIVSDSGEGYTDHGFAADIAERLNPGIEIVDLTEVEQTNPLP